MQRSALIERSIRMAHGTRFRFRAYIHDDEFMHSWLMVMAIIQFILYCDCTSPDSIGIFLVHAKWIAVYGTSSTCLAPFSLFIIIEHNYQFRSIYQDRLYFQMEIEIGNGRRRALDILEFLRVIYAHSQPSVCHSLAALARFIGSSRAQRDLCKN